MVGHGLRRYGVVRSGRKLSRVVGSGRKCSKMVGNGQKWVVIKDSGWTLSEVVLGS